ncbi:hypothetical protein SpCBS45565_g08059 [Spizellomyces sp. 'palustris']|nr:hypothetical protein SpCBS45565_g08059 [Spizellomyces sp. 'palustris']
MNDKTVLDYNTILPPNTTYFSPGIFEVNPHDPSLIAFSYDTTGSETYALYIRDTITGNTWGGWPSYDSAQWAMDRGAHYLYYNAVDPQWGIPRWVLRVCARACPKQRDTRDEVGEQEWVYVEEDPSLTTAVDATSDGLFVFVKVTGQVTSEVRLINSTTTTPLFHRSLAIRYTIDHAHTHFYLLTNALAPNYAIHRLPTAQALASNTTISALFSETPPETVLPASNSQYIERMDLLSSHLVAWVRVRGLRQVVTVDLVSRSMTRPVPPTLETYSLFPGTNTDMDQRLYTEFDSPCLLFSNSSFTVPHATYVHHLGTADTRRMTHKTGSVPFSERRIWVPSTGTPNTLIPISLLTPPTGNPTPILVSAYGAYGGFQDPTWSPHLFSLLRRNISYAICHPRGDGDLGAEWYTSAKYTTKNLTFADVRDCISGLISLGVALPGHIGLYGRSAGGLITGSAVSTSGFNGLVQLVVTQVPFVDPVGDMIDPSMPWVPYEYFEWGNPNDIDVFHAMMDYSPYYHVPMSNLQVFVTTGLKDARVGFYEPLKWVARMREVGLRVLVRVTGQGHFGGVGSEGLREMVEWFAFVVRGIGV